MLAYGEKIDSQFDHLETLSQIEEKKKTEAAEAHKIDQFIEAKPVPAPV